jgi:hypothetical protein
MRPERIGQLPTSIFRILHSVFEIQILNNERGILNFEGSLSQS